MAKEVIIEFRAELNQIKGQLKQLQGQLDKTGDEAKKTQEEIKKIDPATKKLIGTLKDFATAAGLAFGAQQIIQFTKATINAASDLNETLSKTAEIFQSSTSEIVAWSKNSAAAFGQSQTQALDAASNFAIFGKAAGLAGEDLVKFSTDFVQLASDLASFNNTSPEDAIVAIGAALRGESEPIRRYGVLLNEVTLREKAFEAGIVSTIKNALTPQQKVLAAQIAIYEQTGAAQGDFQRTSEGLANSQRILEAQFTNLKAAIGQELLPTALEAVRVLNEMAQGFLFLLNGIDKAEQAEIDAAKSIETNILQSYQKRIDQMAEENRLHELRAEMIRQGIRVDDESVTAGNLYVAMLEDRKEKLEAERVELEKLANLQGASRLDLGQKDWNVQLAITEERLSAINDLLEKYNISLNPKPVEQQTNSLKALQEEIKAANEEFMNAEIGSEAYILARQRVEQLKKEFERLTKAQEDSIKEMQKMRQFMNESLAADLESFQPTLEEFDKMLGMQEEMVWNWQNSQIISRREYNENLVKLEEKRMKKEDELRDEETARRAAENYRRMQEARQLYMDLGMTEAEYTEYRIGLMKYQADALLASGDLTIEQYNKIVQGFKRLQMDSNLAVLESVGVLQAGLGQLFATSITDAEKRAAFEKDMAIFNIIINTAVAIARMVAEANKVPPPGNLAFIATGLATIFSNMAQANAIINQAQAPKFAKGGFIGGRSHADGGTLIEAEAGEFIINKRDARANKDILKAINTGNLSKYVVKHYVEPLTRSMAQERNSLADNIAASLAEQMNSQNGYLRKMSRGVNVNNLDKLAKIMRQPNVNKMRH